MRELEIAGLVLVGVMAAGFMGLLRPAVDPGISPVFLGCAAAVLGIIAYRKWRNARIAGSGSQADA